MSVSEWCSDCGCIHLLQLLGEEAHMEAHMEAHIEVDMEADMEADTEDASGDHPSWQGL